MPDKELNRGDDKDGDKDSQRQRGYKETYTKTNYADIECKMKKIIFNKRNYIYKYHFFTFLIFVKIRPELTTDTNGQALEYRRNLPVLH